MLPPAHTRAVYAVSWSASQPGRVVSCGADGRIVVYEEFEVVVLPTPTDEAEGEGEKKKRKKREWRIVAEVEVAHGVYEINHVCWAKRWDKGKRFEQEEMVVSTGDDGVVNFWELV